MAELLIPAGGLAEASGEPLHLIFQAADARILLLGGALQLL